MITVYDNTMVGDVIIETNKYTLVDGVNLNIGGGLQYTSTIPTSTTSTGTVGQFTYDDDYFYLCIDTNRWKRSLIAEF